jgi:hypothetical protein
MIKLINDHGLESCGFSTNSEPMMEDYCSRVMTNCPGTVRQISVYTCDTMEPMAIFTPRFGLSAFARNMKLIKEIKIGNNPKFKQK